MTDRRPAASLRDSSDIEDEAGLVAAIAAGDAAAWRRFVSQYLGLVTAAAWYRLGNQSDAEDVAQETLLRFFQKAGTWQAGAGSLKAWLVKVAGNLAIDRLRQRRFVSLDNDTGDGIIPLPATMASEAECADMRDNALDIRRALAQLPDRQQTAMLAFYFSGLSQKETAILLEVNEPAVESLLARARRRMREILAEPYEDTVTPKQNRR